jgi:hypothetical protein
VAVILGLGALLSLFPAVPANGQPFTNTVIAFENQKAGSTNWLITNPAQDHQIEGYASATSVDRGGQIDLLVNTTNSAYVLEIFRIGWYGGTGGREVYGPRTIQASRQAIPLPNPAVGLVECNWTNPFSLLIPGPQEDPTEWASGAYVAKLTGSEDGKQSYIIFVVRDDERAADFLVQLSFSTYEAYNNWGGASLYDYNSPRGRASKVSFNRPFALQLPNPSLYWRGAGEFFGSGVGAAFEVNLVHWLEREGYEASYCTSLDTHAVTNMLWGHKAFISMGHDEYWSYPMRWNVVTARDRGVNLAFLSSNVCFWQVRFEPSAADGTPNRTMVCYKSTLDPVFNSPSNMFTTVTFRAPPVLDSESSFLGVSLDTVGVEGDLVVNDPGHWLFSNMAVHAGQRFPGVLGIEVDSTNAFSPTGVQVACASYFGKNSSTPGHAHAASYNGASGATVFAAGTMQWSWGLDDFNSHDYREALQSPAVQHMTRNLLARMANTSAPSATFFFRTDAATVGDWKPHYGFDGYVLPNDSTNLPSYAAVDISAPFSPPLLVSNLDGNSLERAGSTNRYISGWSSPTNFVIDFSASDTNNHQVAFYFWDADNSGRQQIVEVLDETGANVLDQRLIVNCTTGQWWVWQVSGHVQFRFTRLSGPDCMVNALAFGSGGAAAFIGEDTLTQGDWKPYYGAQGEFLAGDSFHNFDYSGHIERIIGGSIRRWSLPPIDLRAPEIYGSTNRILAAWSNSQTVGFLVQFGDNLWHQLAIYCVDADRLGRKQQVSIVDQGNNSVLDSRLLTNFEEGKYLVWNVRGAVKVRVQCMGPADAVVNGIFLDPPSEPHTVALTSPVDGEAFTAQTNVLLAATVVPLSSVRQVEFYTNGALLATTTNTPFNFLWTNLLVGQYQVQAVAVGTRDITTASATANIAVSTPPDYVLPFVELNSPLNNDTNGLPAAILFSATVSATSAPIVSVQFLLDGVSLGSALTNPPFALSNTNIHAGIHSAQALVTDGFGVVVASSTNYFMVLPAAPSAVFQGYDSATQGTWEGLYGADGFVVVAGATNLPAYATATPTGDDSYIWAYSTSVLSALQNPAGPGRIAALWFAEPQLFLDLDLLDGNPHRVALYFLDWLNQGGVETVIVLDAETGVLLDARSVDHFSTGVYLQCDLTGHVQFRFTRSAGTAPPGLSGVFFDPPSLAPRVVLLTPADGRVFGLSTPVQMRALAISGTAPLSRLDFLTNGVPIDGETTGPPYSFTWVNPPPGDYSVSARAIDIAGNSSLSIPVSITVITNVCNAFFAAYDTNHLGHWLGNYGLLGFVISAGRSNPPPFVQLNLIADFFSWGRTLDVRALQDPSGIVPEAAAWFGPAGVDVDMMFNDSAFHRVSLYFLDLDYPSESEAVDVFDAISGALLDHRDLPNLSGVYAIWDVQGQVRFHVSRATIYPAMVSGIFFDERKLLPSISLVTPNPDDFFLVPTNIPLAAALDRQAASAPQISAVKFYADEVLLDSLFSEPYQMIWTNPPVGRHVVWAQVTSPLDAVNSPVVGLTVLSTNDLAFLAVKTRSNGGLQLDVFGPAGQTITLLGSATLDDPTSWAIVATTNAPAFNRLQFVVPDPAVYEKRFYRLSSP